MEVRYRAKHKKTDFNSVLEIETQAPLCIGKQLRVSHPKNRWFVHWGENGPWNLLDVALPNLAGVSLEDVIHEVKTRGLTKHLQMKR